MLSTTTIHPPLPKARICQETRCACSNCTECITCIGPTCPPACLQCGTGAGSANKLEEPTPIASPAGVALAEVWSGDRFSCARGFGGEAFCWGAGSAGELGTGSFRSSRVPARVLDAAAAPPLPPASSPPPPAAPPPLATPQPPPAPPPIVVGGSSVPVGAIVGGVLGGLAGESPAICSSCSGSLKHLLPMPCSKLLLVPCGLPSNASIQRAWLLLPPGPPAVLAAAVGAAWLLVRRRRARRQLAPPPSRGRAGGDAADKMESGTKPLALSDAFGSQLVKGGSTGSAMSGNGDIKSGTAAFRQGRSGRC